MPRNRMRSTRRDEEDIPSTDYIEIMEELGSREHESRLAFRKRMAAIIEARKLWIIAWKTYRGHLRLASESLGLSRGAVRDELRRSGLSAKLLNVIVYDNPNHESDL
jgi:hypothetical protein